MPRLTTVSDVVWRLAHIKLPEWASLSREIHVRACKSHAVYDQKLADHVPRFGGGTDWYLCMDSLSLNRINAEYTWCYDDDGMLVHKSNRWQAW